jgi:putative endonuclease
MNRSGDRRMDVGRSGEALAVRHLERSGYEIAARNWRCRLGEIDIVARRGELLVFVEVRTRSRTERFGTPSESVDWRKQARLRNIVRYYLLAHGLDDATTVRFDVVDIRWNAEGQPAIRHVPNAF